MAWRAETLRLPDESASSEKRSSGCSDGVSTSEGESTSSRSVSGEWRQRRGWRQPARVRVKTGRNERCPCGSGLKHKHCHGLSRRSEPVPR